MLTTVVYAKFEGFRTFLCVFMSVFRGNCKLRILGKSKGLMRDLFGARAESEVKAAILARQISVAWDQIMVFRINRP